MSEPIKILDIIHHRNKYNTQVFHVVDRMPIFLYEREGIWLVGEDAGFFNFYYQETPTKGFQAFAGREFSIPLKGDGDIKANGQWWDGLKPDYQGLLTHVAIGTPEKLSQCYVFIGMWADPFVIPQITHPSNNYYKYDSSHSDSGKHKIQSRWPE